MNNNLKLKFKIKNNHQLNNLMKINLLKVNRMNNKIL